MYDTIIIGAGMSGLAAGIRLAHFGQRVCILERHSAIGGLNSFYWRRGRMFDVGLHALTNWAPKGTRTGPFAKLLKQLRLAWDEWALAPQLGSAIVFPGATLRFSNEFDFLQAEVAWHFPRQTDNFRRMVANLNDYDQFGRGGVGRSARKVVAGWIDDPLLVEMLFCPILFYGGAAEHDIDFDQFSILFRSIFLEGLARPLAGIQRILKMLVRRFQEHGGELRLRAAVARIAVKRGAVEKVVLEDGSELEARNVLSSAGVAETMRLCDDDRPDDEPPAGRMSVVESISILDRPPRLLGYDKAIVFYNDSEKFHYEKPDDLVDLRSGTVCSPNNFAYAEALPCAAGVSPVMNCGAGASPATAAGPAAPQSAAGLAAPQSEGVMRISALANYERWAALQPDAYAQAKLSWYDRLAAAAVRFVPDFRPAVVETDIFTPRTIQRFTGHAAGALYGSARKRRDGTTRLKNLYICGNDQGLVGVIGTIISGISIANRHLLK